MMTTIYVALLNEGVDVWRPVDAVPTGQNAYRILGEVPALEEWEFPPGSTVRCESKVLSGGETRLIAVASV